MAGFPLVRLLDFFDIDDRRVVGFGVVGVGLLVVVADADLELCPVGSALDFDRVVEHGVTEVDSDYSGVEDCQGSVGVVEKPNVLRATVEYQTSNTDGDVDGGIGDHGGRFGRGEFFCHFNYLLNLFPTLHIILQNFKLSSLKMRKALKIL